MIIFTLRRLVLLLITLLLLTFVSFGLSFFPENAPLNDAGFFSGYLQHLTSLLQGNIGVSSVNGQDIANQLGYALPATLELCILAFGLSLIIGLPLGIIAGVSRGKWSDRIINTFALFGFSVPIFWLALLAMLFFSLNLGWFPVSGRYDLIFDIKHITGFAMIDIALSESPYRNEMLINHLQHLILPTLILSVAPIAEVIRLMRISANTVARKNYIKAVEIRGLSPFTIVHRHILRNALPPIIPQLGLQFSTMLTLSMVLETVFNWPGLGQWMIDAQRQQDYAVLSAGVMVIGTMVILINVIADLLGAMANPFKQKEWYALR